MNLSETFVRDLMTAAPLTVKPDVSLRDALRSMHEGGVSCLVVDCGSGRGWGMVTHKDVMSLLGGDEVEVVINGTRVADVMTSPAVTVPPDWRVDTALDLMRMLGVRRAPVVGAAAGELVGILSYTDVFRRVLASIY